MALYPGYGVRNPKYETGIVVQAEKFKHPGSDQNLQFFGELEFPFAPPLVDTNPPTSSFSKPNPRFPNPAGLPSTFKGN